ncbi:unknown protein [Seminavis robusta]|uniref:Uncharacterized protein n=1 Tax=Seminavis robusta TaxID=568900 RepID=A0A9N8E802_9STRA|nr:unknown protein [Seminavis robusta]|eukprot:Sro753_g197440.1 n/a (249) ;mRNA; r:39704-40478
MDVIRSKLFDWNDISISRVVQDQIQNETPSAEAGLEDESLTCGQNHPDAATMHPGAYAMAPGNTTTTPTDHNSELVVANQVEENEEPTQIARPDNLQQKTGSTLTAVMIVVLIGSILILGVIVGSICGAGLCSSKDADVETQAPTSFRYVVLENIENRIEEAFGAGYFPKNDEPGPTQPKFKALDWIVFEDPLQLNHPIRNRPSNLISVGPIWMARYQRNSLQNVPTYFYLGSPTLASLEQSALDCSF